MDTGTCSVNCWTGINCWSMPVKAHIYPARSVWQSTKSLPRVKLSLADHRGRREPLTVTPGRVVGAGRCWSPSVAIVSSMPCELFRSRRMLSTFRSSLYCWREHVITRSSSVWMIVFRATSMTMFCEFTSSVERYLKKLFWFYFNCVVYVLTCTDDFIFCRYAYINIYELSKKFNVGGQYKSRSFEEVRCWISSQLFVLDV